MILVAPVQQLEVVRLRVERLAEKREKKERRLKLVNELIKTSDMCLFKDEA